MLNKKLGKIVAVSVLMVSAIAGSISAGAVAKTRVVQLKEGVNCPPCQGHFEIV